MYLFCLSNTEVSKLLPVSHDLYEVNYLKQGFGACVRFYHPKHHIDGEDCGHPTKWQTLEDAAAGVWAETSFCRAVFLAERFKEAEDIQLNRPWLDRGRPRLKKLWLSHHQWSISDQKYRQKTCMDNLDTINHQTSH